MKLTHFVISPARLLVLSAMLVGCADASRRMAADAPQPKWPDCPALDCSPATLQAAKLLKQTLPEIRFENTVLDRVFEALAERTGLSITVDWQELAACGIEQSAPLTIQLKEVTAEKALRVMLAAAGGAVELEYYLDDGTVVITSTNAMTAFDRSVRLYAVGDLLHEYAPQYRPRLGCQPVLALGPIITADDPWRLHESSPWVAKTPEESARIWLTFLRASVDGFSLWNSCTPEPEGRYALMGEILWFIGNPLEHWAMQQMLQHLRQTAREGQQPQEEAEEHRNRQTRDRLAMRLATVDFDNKPLEQAIQDLRDKANVCIDVNWTVLQSAGVLRDTPITVKLRGKSVESAMQAMLDSLKTAQLGFIVDEGVVIISTEEDLNRCVFTVIHPVSDILDRYLPMQDLTTERDFCLSGREWPALQAQGASEMLLKVLGYWREHILTGDANGFWDERGYLGLLGKYLWYTGPSRQQDQLRELLDAFRASLRSDAP